MAELKNFIEALKCPVCYEILTPPVDTCEKGHGICQNCKASCQRCPVCRGRFANNRNILLNQLLESLPVACKYKANGCSENLSYNNLARHESTCNYRIVNCFICSAKEPVFCKFGRHILQHASLGKSLKMEFNDWKTCIIKASEDSKKGFFSITMHRLFPARSVITLFLLRYTFNRAEKKFCICMQYVGKQEDASRYLYEIRIDQELPLKERIYFSFGGTCIPYSETISPKQSEVLILNLKRVFGTRLDEKESNVTLYFRIMPVEYGGGKPTSVSDTSNLPGQISINQRRCDFKPISRSGSHSTYGSSSDLVRSRSLRDGGIGPRFAQQISPENYRKTNHGERMANRSFRTSLHY